MRCFFFSLNRKLNTVLDIIEKLETKFLFLDALYIYICDDDIFIQFNFATIWNFLSFIYQLYIYKERKFLIKIKSILKRLYHMKKIIIIHITYLILFCFQRNWGYKQLKRWNEPTTNKKCDWVSFLVDFCSSLFVWLR